MGPFRGRMHAFEMYIGLMATRGGMLVCKAGIPEIARPLVQPFSELGLLGSDWLTKFLFSLMDYQTNRFRILMEYWEVVKLQSGV